MTADGLSVQLTAPNGRSYTQPTGLYINGQWVKSDGGVTLASTDPASTIVSVQSGSKSDIDKAVAAARAALKAPAWKNLQSSDRGRLLYRLADLVDEHRETLATIETRDNGKPYTVALNEDMAEATGTLRYYAGFSDKVFGQVMELSPDKFAYTVREPVGVCGQIIPMRQHRRAQTRRADPALDPVLRQSHRRSRLSPGVVNIINGPGSEAGAALATHPDVDKIAFTGSTATAREIMRMAAGTLKNITLETGGKSPLIVFDDAELGNAVEWAHLGIMSNQGQICTATSRILVQEGVHRRFVDAFKQQIREVSRVGDPFGETTYQGPQVTRAQHERILQYIDVGRAEGATLEAGGERVGDRGFFVQPTVFTDVTPEMRIFQEEVFGPFVTIMPFRTEEEAVALANGTQYGLGSAVFTTNLTRAHRVARAIESGMVWINSSNDCDWRIPFGGVKQSGIGRELGEAGLEAYSNVKAIHVNMKSKL
ncbi:aldehyde dehydrogenase domain-containing protein [Apiospora aurea]|uniref:Aldehyde dehydrogenase domain-containing protein n=1 Tax=Apiospora aurea TaxID=335848 RepID=A0ABR1QQ40_9PEZI